jgi:activating signal cointegrator 1
VCEQEGSGSCLFCGNLVCSEEEQRIIDSQSKKGDSLKETLMRHKRPKGWEEALAQRNRLLEYDRNAEKRTTVIDDESDYFKENSVWLSDVERKKLERMQSDMREQKHQSRLNRKVTLDFAGRRVVEDNTSVEIDDEILKKIANVCASKVQSEKLVHDKPDLEFSDTVHPGIEGPAPVFDDSVVDKTAKKAGFVTGYDGTYSKVQDKEFLEMADQRNCISMHQPWASLLVEGIKQHEGRTWYTPVRGRLWIASTQKPADPALVGQMENFYRRHYNDDQLEFPSQYPSGCLLGCVSVQDCLPQEEYRKKFPNGESESPFVLICEEPQALPIRFPNKGEHKICKWNRGFSGFLAI